MPLGTCTVPLGEMEPPVPAEVVMLNLGEQVFKVDAVLRGVTELVVEKSAEFSSVSVQPLSARVIQTVFDGAGAAAVPS